MLRIYPIKMGVVPHGAYEWNPLKRPLLALGVHESFYRDLKKRE
jgi:hypothetical protein